jgi:hypothetical protein
MSINAVNSNGKVTAGHLKKTAYLYIRQSSLRQVFENTESTQRQYGLRQRAVALGWPAERIETIDCDQGQSGATTTEREGFQKLVAEVGLGKAGIVMGLEVSRLARNCADWHRLLEICGSKSITRLSHLKHSHLTRNISPSVRMPARPPSTSQGNHSGLTARVNASNSSGLNVSMGLRLVWSFSTSSASVLRFPWERAKPVLGVPEQSDYFGAQIDTPPGGCFFRVQKILDFVGPDSIDWQVRTKMCLKKTHIGVKLVHVCRRSVRFGGQELLDDVAQRHAVTGAFRPVPLLNSL